MDSRSGVPGDASGVAFRGVESREDFAVWFEVTARPVPRRKEKQSADSATATGAYISVQVKAPVYNIERNRVQCVSWS